MSLIHEALEKAEQEKKGQWKRPVPEISAHGSSKTTPKESLRMIYGISGALLFFFVVGLIYFLTSSSPRTQKPEKKAEVSSPSSSPSSPASLPFIYKGRFSLTGITRTGTEWTAIINNELVRVGDWVSDATVESIQQGEVALAGSLSCLRQARQSGSL